MKEQTENIKTFYNDTDFIVVVNFLKETKKYRVEIIDSVFDAILQTFLFNNKLDAINRAKKINEEYYF